MKQTENMQQVNITVDMDRYVSEWSMDHFKQHFLKTIELLRAEGYRVVVKKTTLEISGSDVVGIVHEKAFRLDEELCEVEYQFNVRAARGAWHAEQAENRKRAYFV
jgi:hypothetical protein